MNIHAINYGYMPKCTMTFGNTIQSAENNNNNNIEENLPASYKRVEFFRHRYNCAKDSLNEVKREQDKAYFEKRLQQDATNLLAACKDAYKDQTGLDLVRIAQVYDKYELTQEQAEVARQYYPELFLDYDDMATAGMEHIVVRTNGCLGSMSYPSER